MSDVELKPCPFCGGKATCIEYYGLFHVICCECHIAGRDRPSIDEAIEAWNSRPIEDVQQAEITRLREALEEIKMNIEFAQETDYPFHIYLDSKDGLYILEVTKEALKGELNE